MKKVVKHYKVEIVFTEGSWFAIRNQTPIFAIKADNPLDAWLWAQDTIKIYELLKK